MNGKYHIEEYVYTDDCNEQLFHMYQEVTSKYPKGIFWSWDPNSREGEHMFLCLDDKNQIIGKGHVMIFEKQQDDAPAYAEHRIFIHYRVLPEYEQEEEALDLLYDRLLECAYEIRKTLSNRACQLCVGNHDFETVYNRHIEKLGWPEYGSIYHLISDTRASQHLTRSVDQLSLHEFSMESMDIKCQLTALDQLCFRDSVASLDNYIEMSQEKYRAFGAFITDSNGKEKIVASVNLTLEAGELGDIPEITGVMVAPEYRRKKIAESLIDMTLDALHQQGYEKVWLVTQCYNKPAIALYEKMGFRIFSHEQRYMKYI